MLDPVQAVLSPTATAAQLFSNGFVAMPELNIERRERCAFLFSYASVEEGSTG